MTDRGDRSRDRSPRRSPRVNTPLVIRRYDLGPGHIVLDGDPAAPKGARSQFSAHDCYGQRDGWINMPLSREMDRPRPHIGPSDIGLQGGPKIFVRLNFTKY